MPINHDFIVKCTGNYLEKTALGYYKMRYMVLTNKELYFYNNKEGIKN